MGTTCKIRGSVKAEILEFQKDGKKWRYNIMKETMGEKFLNI